MARDALVVGINQYPFLKDTPTSKAKHLTTPASDAEAIAQLLENYGDFQVRRLPGNNQDGKLRADSKKPVKLKELQDAISELFNPKGHRIPETAVLFFAGHGFRRTWEGGTEGYLVTSDAGSSKAKYGLSLQWLRKLLSESPVRQQIIWLDCCHSGELLNFTEAELGEDQKERDRCLIVASRDFQVAYGDGEHGMLTNALLQSLDPANRPDGWVTNFTLVDRVRELLKAAPQHPVCTNTGGQIILTGKNGVLANICPYKGLAYFDWNEEDPKYFYGRTRLTNLLLEKVRSGNFLAVLGASGSGKSSVVRAGLLYQLQLGEAIPSSDSWKIYPPFTLGDRPLQRLKEVVGVEAEQLEPLIKAAAAERMVLVVDQFEEVFTQCRDDGERQQFFKCLLETLERTENKLCLVLVMRSDFFGKCTEQEYSGLANKIQEHLVTVMPMNRQELEEAITKPAQRVDLEVERELIAQMIADVEGSPGNLPLMQYTLTELWERKRENRLMISHYTQLGGIKQALEKQANKVYESFLPEEQQIAKWIFLSLTRLGEETEDTRKQVRKQDLITSTRSQALVEKVIERLADAKLIVTRELENEGERVAVVDIAHEALIRHWSLLRSWLDKNREAVIRKQDIEDAAEDWRDKGKPKDSAYLLQGTRLSAAEDYILRYANNVALSSLAKEFIDRSIKRRQHSRLILFGSVATFIVGLSTAAIVANSQRIEAERRGQISLSRQLAAQALSILNKRLDLALLLSLEGYQKSNTFESRSTLLATLEYSPHIQTFLRDFTSSQKAIFSPDGKTLAVIGCKKLERNCKADQIWLWDVTARKTPELPLKGHIGTASKLIFSPDGKAMASIGCAKLDPTYSCDQGEIILYDTATRQPLGMPIKIYASNVNDIVFSPDGKILASVWGSEGKVILWNVETHELIGQPLSGYKNGVNSIAISPNGKILAVGDGDQSEAGGGGDIILWDIETLKPIGIPLSGHKHGVYSLAFSPDSNVLASGSRDDTIILWDIKKLQLIGQPLKGHTSSVKSVAFSPDGKILASSGNDSVVILWDVSNINQLTAKQPTHQILKGHTHIVESVAFSPDGKTLASSSYDDTIIFWDVTRKQQIAQPLLDANGNNQNVAISPDGKILALHSCTQLNNSQRCQGRISLWDLTKRQLREPSLLGYPNGMVSMAFSPDSTILVSSGCSNNPCNQGEIRFWNLSSRKLIGQPLTYHGGEVEILAFSLDAKSLFLRISHEFITLVDVATFQPEYKFDLYSRTFAISPNGRIVAVGEGTDFILWDMLKGQQIGSPLNGLTDAVSSLAFSSDGKILASGGASRSKIRADADKDSNNIILWNMATHQPIGLPLLGHTDSLTSLAFSPNSKMLASGGFEGTIILWDVERGQQLGIPFKVHNNLVKNLLFSKDGKTLISASDDGSVVLWDVNPDSWQSRICKIVARNLTGNEWSQYLPNEPYRKTCPNLP